MAWKSREDKLPPPSFFTLIVAYLQEAYQGARISREMMMTLRPYFIEAWRNGRTAAAAAQTTCSCNGREVIPSPVVGIQIAKGSVRPPKGAQRGDVFGADELRQPSKVERLQHKLERVQREGDKLHSLESRWMQRGQKSKSESVRKEAERKQSVATTKRSGLLVEARRLEDELARLQVELNRVSRQKGAPAESAPVAQSSQPTPQAPALQPAPTTSSEPSVSEKKKRGRKPKGEAAAPTPALPVDAQSAALLGAVQGLLPNLAKQLADQMSKDEK
jgi:hypothetical protein